MAQPGMGKLIVCATGTMACYSYYAVLHEGITRSVYLEAGVAEIFTDMFALVLVQCMVNCVFAQLLLATVMKQGVDTTRTTYYASAALLYLLAMVSSSMALQYVNYPTQVIGKAGKPIPVMILGIFIGRQLMTTVGSIDKLTIIDDSYPFRKYCFVAQIIAGMIMFMYTEKAASKQTESVSYGYLLLAFSLILDGLLGAVQDRMRAEHQTKSCHMMLNMNMWSTLFNAVIVLYTGECFSFLNFLHRHPCVLQQIMILSACGALGQYFIFLTVAEFGPLTCSIVTTIRKCFTVLVSVMFYGNTLIVRQWLGAAIVFLGLFLDIFYGNQKTVVSDN